ncbi:hypothetical protein RDV64_14675 [Acuticoccus sp. MNP-M23]|uniref:DUF7220 family protein n=1 Tax=Acuticoccus sp. MNP-M23 TaxID=3072793 RepID=UPI00281632FF|nr:hypothetical protein [Acuticoccus sp. MNP-M23]WMS41321.1 hypothetical protein RDV64_14675 [Acuticoccus sp. MNP-M23]
MVVGYAIAIATQLVVFASFGLPVRISDALGIGTVFTHLEPGAQRRSAAGVRGVSGPHLQFSLGEADLGPPR